MTWRLVSRGLDVSLSFARANRTFGSLYFDFSFLFQYFLNFFMTAAWKRLKERRGEAEGKIIAYRYIFLLLLVDYLLIKQKAKKKLNAHFCILTSVLFLSPVQFLWLVLLYCMMKSSLLSSSNSPVDWEFFLRQTDNVLQ